MTTRVLCSLLATMLLTACGGTPEPIETEPEPARSGADVDVAFVDSLQEIEGKIWLSRFSDASLYVMSPDGVFWNLRISENADMGDCTRYLQYGGEFAATEVEGRFDWKRQIGGDLTPSTLSIVNEGLNIRSENNLYQERYLPSDQTFEDLPPLCDFSPPLPTEDSRAVNDLTELEGLWQTDGNTSFGEDRLLWIFDSNALFFRDYFGDTHARGDDCYDSPTLRNVFFPVGGNRYLEVFESGRLNDVRIYEGNVGVFFARDEQTTFIGRRDSDAEQTFSSCISTAEIPDNAEQIVDLADASGFWRLEYRVNETQVDTMLLSIQEDGTVRLFDERNDSFNRGEQCSIAYPEFATLAEDEDEGRFTWTRSSNSPPFTNILGTEVTLYFQEQDLLIIGDNASRYFAATELTDADIPVQCGRLDSIPVASLSDITNRLWLATEGDGTPFAYFDAEGYAWQMSESTNGDCYNYERLLGQFVQSEGARYRYELFERNLGTVELGIKQGDFWVIELDSNNEVSDVVVYLQQDMTFEERPPICEVTRIEPPPNTSPVESIESVSGVWQTVNTTSVGEDISYWVFNDSTRSFIGYFGDSRARGEDCYARPRFNRGYFQVEGNRYLEINSTGVISDIRLFRDDQRLIFNRPLENRTLGTSDLVENDLLPICANRNNPPPDGTRVNDFDEISGVWRLSYVFDDDRIDSIYASIAIDGTVTLFDPQNDTFNNGEQCSVVYDEFARLSESANPGDFNWSRNESIPFIQNVLGSTVSLYRQGQDLLLLGNQSFRRFRQTDLSLEEISFPCTSTGGLPAAINELTNRMWQSAITDNAESFIYFEPDGYAWQMEASENEECFNYSLLLGQFVDLQNNTYQRSRVGRDLGLHEIGIAQDNLIINDLERSEINEYLPTDITFTQRPPICDLNALVPSGDIQPITNVEELDGNYGSAPAGRFGGNLIFWTAEAGVENLFDFLGDDNSRAEDCFLPLGIDRQNFNIGSNRFIVAFPSGTIIDGDFYLRGSDQLFAVPDAIFGRFIANFDPSTPDGVCLTENELPLDAVTVRDASEIAGLWDISRESDVGSTDTMYLHIEVDGRIDIIDPQNDSFANGARCSDVYAGFAQINPLGDGRFSWQREDILFTNILGNEITIVEHNEDLIFAGSAARRVFKKTELTRNDLPLNCELPLSDLTLIEGQVWDDTFDFLNILDIRYISVNADGSIDTYNYQLDDVGTGEDCYIVETNTEQLDSTGSGNRYSYVTDTGSREVSVSLINNELTFAFENTARTDNFPFIASTTEGLTPICAP